MAQKKNSSNAKPQASFQQLVAEAVNQKLLQTVDSRINQLAMFLHRQFQGNFEDVYARLQALEDILAEKFSLTENDFAFKVAEVQDRAEGLVTVETVGADDLVRLEIATKQKDQAEFQGSTRAKVYNVGSGKTYGMEIESALLGMNVGETKEINFGQDNAMVAKLSVQRISRKPATNAASSEGTNENSDA